MDSTKETSVLVQVIRDGYDKLFYQNWPIMISAVLLGLTNFFSFAWARPWGVAGGLRNWGDNLFAWMGIYSSQPTSILTSSNSILVIGLLWGALVSALLSKQFALRIAPPFELFKGLVGGVLMGIGAAMSGGCNIGGFYSAVAAFSLSGWTMMIGLFVGAYLGLRYLYWEMAKLPPSLQFGGQSKEFTFGLKQNGPLAGIILFGLSLLCAYLYSDNAYTRIGILLLCGLAFGIIMHRSRFCFVKSFRDPMMTGDGSMTKGVIVSVLICMLGFAALKWTGTRGEGIYVVSSFWFGSLVGGIIFGFGMVVAGGCGSGSLWRAGEGHLKLIIAVVFFALSTSLFKLWINSSEGLRSFMGGRVYLPDFLTYPGAILAVAVAFAVLYLLIAWNERSEKFVVEI